MCSKTFSYLDFELNIKQLVLALLTALLLSGCGIKGDLYQTPEEPNVAKKSVVQTNGESTSVLVETTEEESSKAPKEQSKEQK